MLSNSPRTVIASGGSLAGAISLSLIYSLDYAHNRLANDVKDGLKGNTQQFDGLIDVYAKTFRSDGIVGLYRGFFVSCLGIIVYRGCYFGFYDSLKPIIVGKDAGYVSSYIFGFCVTVSAGFISYPVRRRMLMRSGEPVKYKGVVECFTTIVRNEGFLSLMKGVSVNIISGIYGALLLTGYDKIKTRYSNRK